MKNKLEKLEAIRGLAALYVVFHHSFFSENFKVFNHDLSFIFKFGQEAVILFFLMSGFVIGYSFEQSGDKSFWSYFQKRFYRIYIPLVIVLVTQYAWACFTFGALLHPRWLQLTGNLLMLQDVPFKANVICNPYLGNIPLWSLSYEWWFYMAFYLFYSWFPKFRLIEIFVAAMIIISAITYIWYPNIINRILMYYGIWWTGVTMARSYLKYSEVRLRDLRLSLISLTIATGILAYNCLIHKQNITTTGSSPLLELRHFGFTLVAISIAMIWQSARWRYFDTLFGKFALLAPCSYVLYITHYFLVSKSLYLNFLGNRYLEFFIYLAIAITYSFIVETWLFPKIRNYIISRSRKAPSSTTIPDIAVPTTIDNLTHAG